MQLTKHLAHMAQNIAAKFPLSKACLSIIFNTNSIVSTIVTIREPKQIVPKLVVNARFADFIVGFCTGTETSPSNDGIPKK